MNRRSIGITLCSCTALFVLVLLTTTVFAAPKSVPTHTDLAYGAHPHQILDIYVPPTGDGPFPILIWYGGLREPSKHVPDLNRFLPKKIAVIGVETRTLTDGMQDKVQPSVQYVMDDACRAV